jgi:hypothetical protein
MPAINQRHPESIHFHVFGGKNYHDVGRFAEVLAFGATDCAFASP